MIKRTALTRCQCGNLHTGSFCDQCEAEWSWTEHFAANPQDLETLGLQYLETENEEGLAAV